MKSLYGYKILKNRGKASGDYYIGTEVKVDEVTVALLMALLKIARASSNQNHIDSWIDCCGYMACGGELAMLEVES